MKDDIISKSALLKQLNNSERFNNPDIPAYVFGIIKGMPEAEEYTELKKDYEELKERYYRQNAKILVLLDEYERSDT